MNFLINTSESKIQRVVDYFAVVGLPVKLANKAKSEQEESNNDYFSYPCNFEQSASITDNGRRFHYEKSDPIVDLEILNKSLNESVPHGFECLWSTKAGYSANLNYSESLFKTQHEMFLCIRRGRDKSPITDIGVFYEGNERVMNGCHVIKKTVGGNSANINNSSFSGDRIFITYRRSNELACNSLAVIDVCVIIKSKVNFIKF